MSVQSCPGFVRFKSRAWDLKLGSALPGLSLPLPVQRRPAGWATGLGVGSLGLEYLAAVQARLLPGGLPTFGVTAVVVGPQAPLATVRPNASTIPTPPQDRTVTADTRLRSPVPGLVVLLTRPAGQDAAPSPPAM